MSVFKKQAPAPMVNWGGAKSKSNVVSHGKMNTTKNMSSGGTAKGMGISGGGMKSGKSGCSTCGR